MNRFESRFFEKRASMSSSPNSEKTFVPHPPPLPEVYQENLSLERKFSLLGYIKILVSLMTNNPFVSGFLLGQILMFIFLSVFANQTTSYFMKILGLGLDS